MKTNLQTSILFLLSFFLVNFASAQTSGCVIGNANPTNIVYKVNGVTVPSLSGNVTPGSTVTVTFKTPSGSQASNFSLVSYKAPANFFTEQNATQQTVFDSETKTVNGGSSTHSLEVTVPNCYFQVDFVKGCVIQQFGPAGSNNYYGKQGRLIEADNGGSTACITTPPPASTSCVQSNQCFDFAYSYVTNNNNTVTIKFDVTVNCNHDLSNVAFELPAGVTASAYTGNGQVENPTNNPFYSIKWNTNAGGKNGAVRSFTYTVSASAFASMTTIRAHAKASTTVGQVTFNKNGCGSTPPPTCTLAANISGPASVCPSTTQAYSFTTAAQAGATYNWTVPAGFSILSGQNSNTISVRANAGATAGNVAVAITKNGCTSANDTYAVAISTNCGPTPPVTTAPCVQSSQCFDFAYSYVTNNNNTVTIKFDVTVNCNHDLSNVAFELPAGVTASAYTGNGQIENPTNNPFYSIKWNTNAGGKNGAVRSFTYTVSASAFASMTTIRAHAKASTTVGQVTFNAQGCGSTPPPSCAIIANITGPDTVCAFSDTPYTFTTPAQANATYNWTVPADWTINGNANSNSITVMVGADAGQVMVTVTNTCGTATDTQPVAVNEECGNIAPLPVELISFEGSATAQGIALNWATASEENNDRFEVQRSQDGRSFETVGTLKGNGTSANRHEYNFLDKTAKAGLNYYRLRQVDFNGANEFSKVISISTKAGLESAVTLYPNPTTDGAFNIRMTPSKEAVSIQIMDVSGKMIMDKQVSNTAEMNINGSALGMKAGIYLVRVKAGNSVAVEKLIVR